MPDPRVSLEDEAIFDQSQARALELIRTGKTWFLYAVADDLTGEYILAAPETSIDALPRDVLARLVLRATEATAHELREALGDV